MYTSSVMGEYGGGGGGTWCGLTSVLIPASPWIRVAHTLPGAVLGGWEIARSVGPFPSVHFAASAGETLTHAKPASTDNTSTLSLTVSPSVVDAPS